MKSILQVSIVETDTRRAVVVRLFGIPVYHRKELNIQTEPMRIARYFCTTGTLQEPKNDKEDVTED